MILISAKLLLLFSNSNITVLQKNLITNVIFLLSERLQPYASPVESNQGDGCSPTISRRTGTQDPSPHNVLTVFQEINKSLRLKFVEKQEASLLRSSDSHVFLALFDDTERTLPPPPKVLKHFSGFVLTV